MSLAVNYQSKITVVETLEGEFVNPDDATVTVDQLNSSANLDGDTDVPVTKHTAFTQALTAGAATIDLTSLPDLNGAAGAVTGLGLKVQLVKFKAPDSNANVITISEGASNGYALLGASFTFKLLPGQTTGPIYLDDAAPDIASGDRTIDLAGTGSQELEVQFVMG